MKCLNCFKDIGDEGLCPFCGCDMQAFHNKANCLQPGTLLNNERYLIGKALNAGGFGIVYRAYDLKLEIVVAIKEFFPANLATRVAGKKEIILIENTRGISFSQSKESFLKEAQIMEKCKNNPNIVFVRDWFEENNTAYIVMEFLGGINIRDYLQQNDNKLDLDSVIWITRQIINGLKYIHLQGYIFRDLTPDNIMITTEYDEQGHNIVKLIDFGAAVDINTSVDTSKDDIILKPGYAPIEQYVSGGILGAYTDIYALGATIYRMLSGVVPYEVTDRDKNDILEKLIDIDNTIPEYIDRTVMKAMAINKKIRFQTLDDFEAAFIHDKEVMYPEEELKKLKTKKKLFFALMITVCVALSSVGGYILNRRDTGIKNIQLSQDSISVMLPYKEENDKKYLEEIVDDYEKENDKIKVEVEYVPADLYDATLNSKEEYPTVFFSNDNVPQEKLEPLNDLIDSIDLDDYFLFDQIENQLETSIPLGFDAAVCYVNDNIGQNQSIFATENLSDTKVAYHLDFLAAAEKSLYSQLVTKDSFYAEQVPYYIGKISEWEEISSRLPGQWSVIPYTEQLQIRFGDFVSISKSASENQKNAGLLFIYELLSDLAQNNRYIQMTGLIPVNKQTFDLYFEINNNFSFITEQKKYQIYDSSMIQENEKCVNEYNKGGQ